MQLGFIGLGHMGAAIARRLHDLGHQLVVFDLRDEMVDAFVELGARAASSPKEVADRVDTVLASLPSLAASVDVATGADGVIHGSQVKRFVDLSTVGSRVATQIHDQLAERDIASIDSPVSGGIRAARNGTLAVMISGAPREVEAVKPILKTIGRTFYLGDKPGLAQTMKLANNMLSATGLAATAEVVTMGVKSGLDAAAMIEVLNAGSGASIASRDKFPRAILPRTFDFGFATGLMVKDVRLFVDEAKELGLSMEIAEAVARLWEVVLRDAGPESDFTSVIKPIERAAGVIVGESSQAAG
ncbi:NAD(P)-dependent oxidoreductase [Mycobacterium sp. pUA109]|uniref:NAD(P)-dependent oxidoreductase n=1 Tax=Mycobacterium sp. pUA109 TaxID=3238982 RepID=UPI00351AC316